MQTLQHASLKNDFLYQMQIILADIQSKAYSFMMKRIPKGFNIFARKNKDVMFLFLYRIYAPSLSRGHQTVTIMNLKIYCF